MKQSSLSSGSASAWHRPWRKFQSNRRGYWSLLVFMGLFVAALGAEIIANDRPLLLSYQHRLYVPVLFDYPETTFGGDFASFTNYRDPYIRDKINQNGWMVWPPIKFSYVTIGNNPGQSYPAPPSAEHWLGTDDQGRDILAQLLYGYRYSIIFGLALTVLSSGIGVIAGAIQGYLGGVTDLLLQRFIEIWSGMPQLFLLIILAAIIEPNFWWLLGLMVLFSWIALVGVVRTEFVRARNFEYVLAARALGIAPPRIIFRHILPNALVATVTFLPFILNGSLTLLVSLDFLGFGLPPGSPSLGALLSQAKANIESPWIGLSIFVLLALVLCLLIFIGEALRDAVSERSLDTQRP
ncbi:MAG: ABC transporter permease [Candidatus Symbiobacter sp.]|nr:ABC transporter permease [Candidatus Symbiobacter sp.]